MKTKAASKGTGESISLVTAALASQEAAPLIPQNEDPSFIHPVSAFPPLSAFDISVKYPALVIPARQTAELRKTLKSVLLQRAKLKVVYPVSEFDPIPTQEKPRNSFRKMVLVDRPDVFETKEIQDLLQTGDFVKATHNVTAAYADWTVEEVLRRILPVDEVPSAFEIIGHLAHINLRDELLPYKNIVGKVVLDKNKPRIKTVVNKIGTIETEYRTFGMEVIAGNQEAGWSNVTLKEEGCQYTLDFRKVYWNSRLGGEHRRLVDVIRRDAEQKDQPVVVADLMAGIGPFAIPLTCKGYGIPVHANDLNPSSHEYLVINSKNNRCENLSCYNMDARAFCHQLQDEEIDFHHVLMNLPKTAPNFLDAFRGFTGKSLPRIHVHCFAPKDPKEAEKETIERCSKSLGCALDAKEHNLTIHNVRNVAPTKFMYCVSFDLPRTVRALPRVKLEVREAADEPEHKRTKLS